MVSPKIMYLLHVPTLYIQNCVLTLHFYYDTPGAGTSASPTVCNGRTTTLMCDITQSSGVNPAWRVFSTSETSESPVTNLASGQNSPHYNYPTVQPGDTVVRLEVNASSNIDGYHFQCRLPLVTPVDSPSTGTIKVTGTYVCDGWK